MAPFDGSDTSKQRGSARPCANEVVGGTAAVKYCQGPSDLMHACYRNRAPKVRKCISPYRPGTLLILMVNMLRRRTALLSPFAQALITVYVMANFIITTHDRLPRPGGFRVQF